MKSLSNAMAAALTITALTGCNRSPGDLGYVPVDPETLAALPETPITAIIDQKDTYTLPVDGVAACFNYYQQQQQTAMFWRRKIDAECVDREGNIILLIRDGTPLLRSGKPQAPAASPQ